MLGKVKEMAKKILGRKKELQERRDKFIQEYRQLVEKYNLDFAVRLKVTNLGIFPEIYIVERKDDKSSRDSNPQQTNQ
ncbi:MAG: hypothetical protein ACO2PO_23400 [Candidatus Calescibacterium sp.]